MWKIKEMGKELPDVPSPEPCVSAAAEAVLWNHSRVGRKFL